MRTRTVHSTTGNPIVNVNGTPFDGTITFRTVTKWPSTGGSAGSRGPQKKGTGITIPVVEGVFTVQLRVHDTENATEERFSWHLSDRQSGEFNLAYGDGSPVNIVDLWPLSEARPEGITPVFPGDPVSGLDNDVPYEDQENKGQANGYGSLDSTGRQPLGELNDAVVQAQNNLNDLGNVSESQRALEMWDNFVAHYSQLIYTRNGASLIGHWPLYGNSLDYSFNGAATSEEKIITGLSGPIGGNTYFNGEHSDIDVQNVTAGLFDGSSGTLSFWMRPYNRNYFQTSTHGPRLIWFTVDANNWINIQSLTSNDLIYCSYRAGGVNSDRFITISDGDPHMISITWDKTADEVKVYLDGVQQGATLTGLGTWSGVPSTMFIGRGVDGERFWNGWIHSVELHNTALTLADFQARAAMKKPGYTLPTYRHIRCYGDSITFGTGATNDDGWVELTSNTLRTTEDALYLLDNYGRGGNTAGDIVLRVQQDTYLSGLDTITIMLGMNDYGQQTPLATFNTNLTDIVQACKPRTNKVLLVNIPFTTLNETITRAQYNAEIAAVATAESVTLVDVSNAYGLPQVPDGTHPNDEGHAILAGIIGSAILS